MQITATTRAGGTTRTAAGAPATSGNAFAQAMTTQTKAQAQAKASADAVQVTARSKTTRTGRVMRPILIPKAAGLPQANGTAAAAKRATTTAAETRAAYGEGTLASVLARIRRT